MVTFFVGRLGAIVVVEAGGNQLFVTLKAALCILYQSTYTFCVRGKSHFLPSPYSFLSSMKTNRCLFVCLLLISSSVPFFSFSQEAPALHPPVINPDRTITFQHYAPAANKVMLVWSDEYGLPLEANDYIFIPEGNGIWQLTIPPIPPNVYRYVFYVDGEYLQDNTNPEVVINSKGVSSMLTVPLFPDDTYFRINTEIPMGEIQNRVYYSQTIGSMREVNIYLPPGHNRKMPYPILYLLHNKEDGMNAWFLYGKIQYMMDHLLAEGKIEPTIVVMPVSRAMAQQGTSEENTNQLRLDIISSLVPAMSQWFAIEKPADRHAIAGVGSGAEEALNLVLHYPGHFQKLGLLSYDLGGITTTDRELMSSFLKNGHSFGWLFIGDSENSDNRFDISMAFDQLEIDYNMARVKGMSRNWVLWRHLFYRELMPRMFPKR